MINEELRREMEKAYEEGRNDEALELSQKLDLQIAEHQKNSKQNHKTKKKSVSKPNKVFHIRFNPNNHGI